MIILKSAAEIEKMERSAGLARQILLEICKAATPGLTTAELDHKTQALCVAFGAKPSFKGYRGYPAAICCSLNDEVVHGIPGPQVLKDGDILSLDFGVLLDGFHGDTAITIPIGRIKPEAAKLLEVTEASLKAGIEQMQVGNRLGDVSAVIQKVAEDAGYSVVRQLVGHGIGRALHEDPQVPNFGLAGRGVKLQAGMVLAVEPMVNIGGYEVRFLNDGWTTVTADGTLSAHFEHTIAVTDEGPRILSLPWR